MSVLSSYPQEELQRELIAKLQECQGKRDQPCIIIKHPFFRIGDKTKLQMFKCRKI